MRSLVLTMRRPALPWPTLAAGVWLAALVAAGWVSLSSYVQWTLQALVLGIAAMTATARCVPVRHSARYAIPAVLLFLLALLMPVKTFLFFGFAFTVFFGLERSGITLPFLGWASLLLSSPLFEYGVVAFSFPIRLKLAACTGRLFAALGSGVTVKANVIHYRGFEFSVDPACMGLHMLSISLLLGVIFLGLLQKKCGRSLGWSLALLYLAVIVLLNIISNLLRIVLLVQFRILPGTVLHDAVGLLCLLAYVCVPAAFIARRLLLRRGRVLTGGEFAVRRWKPLPWLLLLLMTAAVVRVRTADTYEGLGLASSKSLPGYRSSWFVPGVLKLQGDSSLIYIKFIRAFYDTEHNPSMCWTGSGYDLRETREEEVAGGNIFTARLVRGRESLYTAWWYSDGRTAITDQWSWRWQMLRGGHRYAVVNVSCADREELYRRIDGLLHRRTLLPLIHQ